MLALTRRINEEVVIGDPDNPLGVIRVVSVHGDKVRLSFDFPREVEINRRELADLKRKTVDGDQPKGNGRDSNPKAAAAGDQKKDDSKPSNGDQKKGDHNKANEDEAA